MVERPKQKGEKDLYQVVPIEKWIQKAMAADLHPQVAALIETFSEAGTAPYLALPKRRLETPRVLGHGLVDCRI